MSSFFRERRVRPKILLHPKLKITTEVQRVSAVRGESLVRILSRNDAVESRIQYTESRIQKENSSGQGHNARPTRASRPSLSSDGRKDDGPFVISFRELVLLLDSEFWILNSLNQSG